MEIQSMALGQMGCPVGKNNKHKVGFIPNTQHQNKFQMDQISEFKKRKNYKSTRKK